MWSRSSRGGYVIAALVAAVLLSAAPVCAAGREPAPPNPWADALIMGGLFAGTVASGAFCVILVRALIPMVPYTRRVWRRDAAPPAPKRRQSGQPYRVAGYEFLGDRDGSRLRFQPTPVTRMLMVLPCVACGLYAACVVLIIVPDFLFPRPGSRSSADGLLMSLLLFFAAGALGCVYFAVRVVLWERRPWILDRAGDGVLHGDTWLCALRSVSGVEITRRYSRFESLYGVWLKRAAASGPATPVRLVGHAVNPMRLSEVHAFAHEIADFLGGEVTGRSVGRGWYREEEWPRIGHSPVARTKNTLTLAGRFRTPDAGFVFDRAKNRLTRGDGTPLAALSDVHGLEMQFPDLCSYRLQAVLGDGRRIQILSGNNRRLMEAAAREIAAFLGLHERDPAAQER